MLFRSLALASNLRARLRLAPRWRLLLLAAAPALALAVVVAILLYGSPTAAQGAPPRAAPVPVRAAADGTTGLPPPAGLLVQVSGAVAHPGLYRLAKGERASAAVAAAGGTTPDADPNRLPNLAQVLRDGQEIKVPSLLTAPKGSSSSAAASAAARVAPLDLNAATRDELAAVPGFSQDLAVAAIQYRTQFGGFTSTRELVDVLNMSEADYLLAARYLRV
jgi:competence protein ComEA